MKKLALLVAALLLTGCVGAAFAENEAFIPQMRYEDMEQLGLVWAPQDENGEVIRYSVSSWDLRYFAHYDANGDLASYEVSNEDYSITVEYDLFGNVISVDMKDENGVNHHYDMKQQSWLIWNQISNTYDIPDDTDLQINADLLPAPLLVLDQNTGK